MFSDILITVDVDRTLTDTKSRIPQRNLEAIRYFTENGGAFTVNTGRSLNTFRPLMDRVPTNAPLLLFNGAAKYHDGRYMSYKTIDLDMHQVLRQCREEFPHLNLEIQALDTHYLIEPTPEFEKMYHGMKWDYRIANIGDDMGPFLKFSLFGNPGYDKFGTMYDYSPEELADIDRIEKRIQQLWGHKVETMRPAPRIIDAQAKGATKGRSARELLKFLGRKILVCVGDGENDVSMLREADYAFCPADGVMADRFPTVCSCDEGAVAHVIYEKIPEILHK